MLTAKPPALCTTTTSQLIVDHLNSLHVARQTFIQSEASNKLKTAIQRQTHTVTSKMFAVGKAWHGPGVVLGVDSNVALVRHGGSHLRVSPCHIRKVKVHSQSMTAKLEDIENGEHPILNQEEEHSKQNNQEIPSQGQQDSDHTNSNIES